MKSKTRKRVNRRVDWIPAAHSFFLIKKGKKKRKKKYFDWGYCRFFVRPSSWLVIDPDCGLAGSRPIHTIPARLLLLLLLLLAGVPPVGSAQIFRSTAIVNWPLDTTTKKQKWVWEKIEKYYFFLFDFLLSGAGRKWANSYYYHLFGLLLPLLLFFVDLFIWRRWTADEQSGSSLFWLSFFLLLSWVAAALRFPFDSGRHGDDNETTIAYELPRRRKIWFPFKCGSGIKPIAFYLSMPSREGGKNSFWIALRHKSRLLLCLDLLKIR